MDLTYNRPTLMQTGRYHNSIEIKRFAFKQPFEKVWLPVTFHSGDEMMYAQNQAILMTDHIAKYLADLELPEGIEGKATVNFMLYPARKRRFLFPQDIGQIGLPEISIQTELGSSALSMHHERNRNRKGLIQIEVLGAGIAEDAIDELLKWYDTQRGQLELYCKREDFGTITNLCYVTNRLTLGLS